MMITWRVCTLIHLASLSWKMSGWRRHNNTWRVKRN